MQGTDAGSDEKPWVSNNKRETVVELREQFYIVLVTSAASISTKWDPAGVKKTLLLCRKSSVSTYN